MIRFQFYLIKKANVRSEHPECKLCNQYSKSEVLEKF